LDDTSVLIVGSANIRIAKICWRYNGASEGWVVDGRSLTCSELFKTVIPPPLFNYKIDLEHVPKCLHCTESIIFVGLKNAVVAI